MAVWLSFLMKKCRKFWNKKSTSQNWIESLQEDVTTLHWTTGFIGIQELDISREKLFHNFLATYSKAAFETLQVKLITLFYSHIFHGNVLSFSFSLSLELDHFCQMIVLTNDRRSNDLGFPAHLFMTRDDGSKLTSSSYFSR